MAAFKAGAMRRRGMSDDETESDSIGPDIDLEKIAEDGSDEDTHGSDDGHGHSHDAHDHDDAPAGRTTAPQSEFTTKEAMIGALVTLIGIVVAYAVPGLLG
jgi:hypothetical protein